MCIILYELKFARMNDLIDIAQVDSIVICGSNCINLEKSHLGSDWG